MKPLIEKDAIVLFQGDSITDAGRNREDGNDLGPGYAMMAAAWFMASHSDLNVKFLNRGISGNTVKDLQGRWTEDCLDLKPTWVSILIGINDTWWAGVKAEEYEAAYRDILDRVKDNLNARLILMEPYIMPVTEDYDRVRSPLDLKIDIVRKLAREYDAILITVDGIFAKACTERESSYWTPDGVHLFPAGNALLAQSWLKAVKAIK
ncbi:MAG: SGNH/GDSL hydrolase family protein [Armatimonadota bacterium]